MTDNPFKKGGTGKALAVARPVLTAQDWCDERNHNLHRDDVEWIVGPNGPFLRDKPAWTERRTREIGRKREAERQDFLRRNRLGQYSAPEPNPTYGALTE